MTEGRENRERERQHHVFPTTLGLQLDWGERKVLCSQSFGSLGSVCNPCYHCTRIACGLGTRELRERKKRKCLYSLIVRSFFSYFLSQNERTSEALSYSADDHLWVSGCMQFTQGRDTGWVVFQILVFSHNLPIVYFQIHKLPAPSIVSRFCSCIQRVEHSVVCLSHCIQNKSALDVFLHWSFNLIQLWSENILCNISLFLNSLSTQHMVSLGKHLIHTWKTVFQRCWV